MKSSKILITGGAGFIGSHLAQRLCGKYKIVIFDNLRRNSLKDLPALKNHPNVEFVKGDILKRKTVSRLVKDCDIIIHLAAIAGVSSYYKEPAETLRVNLIGTINVLESCKDMNIKKLIYFSTSEVYGQDAFGVNEESGYRIGPITDFRWNYAVSKIASEFLVIRYGEKYGFKAFSIRPFNIYGPLQTGEGAVSNFLRAAIRKQPITIYGKGDAIRAWCYISDCVDAVETLIKNKNIKSGVFNIGNPKETYTTLELARIVQKIINYRVPIILKKVDRTEIQARKPNINKATKILGYKPKINLTKGLKLTYRYYQELS